MSKLDNLRKSGFKNNMPSVTDDYYEVEVIKWNRELLLKDSSSLAKYNSSLFMPFGVWLSKIENIDIEAINDISLSLLFDKYCLYCIAALTERINSRRNKSYLDIISYCEREKLRYTTEIEVNKPSIIYLYNNSYIDTIYDSISLSNDYKAAVVGANSIADMFKK